MFGKVRRVLNWARIPRTNPVPNAATVAKDIRSTAMKIVEGETFSISMIFCRL